MKKIIFVLISIFVLNGCLFNNKKTSKSDKTMSEADFDIFLNSRMAKNNSTIIINNGEILDIILPDSFNFYSSNFGRSGNFIMYEFLEKGYEFSNFKRLITVNVFENIPNPSVDLHMKNLKTIFTNQSDTCKEENLSFEILEKSENEAIFLMKCSKLVPGGLSMQKGNQGEASLFKIYSKNNKIITILYSFRQKPFELKDGIYPISEKEYNEFLSLTGETLYCNNTTEDPLCKVIVYGKNPKIFSDIEYMIPQNYSSNSRELNKLKIREVITKNGESLEETRGNAILIYKIPKEKPSREMYYYMIASLSNKNINIERVGVPVNNLGIFRNEFTGTGVKFKNKNEKGVADPFFLLMLNGENDYIFIQIIVDKWEDLRSDFVNNFIKSIRYR